MYTVNPLGREEISVLTDSQIVAGEGAAHTKQSEANK